MVIFITQVRAMAFQEKQLACAAECRADRFLEWISPTTALCRYNQRTSEQVRERVAPGLLRGS